MLILGSGVALSPGPSGREGQGAGSGDGLESAELADHV